MSNLVLVGEDKSVPVSEPPSDKYEDSDVDNTDDLRRTDFNGEISRHGLTEVFKPKPGVVPIASIIFVHGLFGHPKNTWTGSTKHHSSSSDKLKAASRNNGVFWPATLLPQSLPRVRIFTWGYDADVDRFFSTASQNTIFQHATDLLSDVANLLELQETKLPVIFVVHSLGGIIVKDALTQSSQAHGTPRLMNVAPAVHGVCFLGTPHRGSASASMGKIAYRVTSAASRRPNLRLLQALEKNSETLDRVSKGFVQILARNDIEVCSFREQKETRKLFFFNTIVVDADSAIIGLSNEDIGSIPENHSKMTKFSSPNDTGFRRVSAQLRRWTQQIREKEALDVSPETKCLDSLYNETLQMRIQNVSDAHEKTFHWLFDEKVVPFSHWIRDSTNNAIFWIQGKPGSGKFAMKEPRMREGLAASRGQGYTIAGFFFHDRGSIAQKSISGMLQGILHSILSQTPSLRRFVVPEFTKVCHSQQTRSPHWTLEALTAGLEAIAQQREVTARLCVFLDALDEHDGDQDKLLDIIFNLISLSDGELIKFKICLASRPWNTFKLRLSKYPGFSIHDYTKDDILAYASGKLSIQTHDHSMNLDMLTEAISNRAQGVFIWVRLVVEQLSKGIRDGSSLVALQQILADMPTELKDMYAHILRKIEPEYSKEVYIILQVVVCALKPLSLSTVVTSTILATMRTTLGHLESLGTLNDTIHGQSLESMLLYLASRSGGLLEVVEAGQINTGSIPSIQTNTDEHVESSDSKLIVQFIHQTAKEYIEEAKHDLELPIMEKNRATGYYYLLGAAATSNQWVDAIFSDVFHYANLAQNHSPNLDIDGFNDLLALLAKGGMGSSLSNIRRWMTENESYEFFRLFISVLPDFSDDALLLLVAVAANLTTFVEARFKSIVGVQPYADIMMQIALTGPKIIPNDKSYGKMIELLIKLGVVADISIKRPLLGFADRGVVNQDTFEGYTPVELLLFLKGCKIPPNSQGNDRFSIFRCLFDKNPSSVNKILGFYGTNKRTGSWRNERNGHWLTEHYKPMIGFSPIRNNYADGRGYDFPVALCATWETLETFQLFIQHGAWLPSRYSIPALLLWRWLRDDGFGSSAAWANYLRGLWSQTCLESESHAEDSAGSVNNFSVRNAVMMATVNLGATAFPFYRGCVPE